MAYAPHKTDVVEQVRALLKQNAPVHELQDLRIEVLADNVRIEGGSDDEPFQYYVPIRPAEQPRRTSPYFELLAEVETEMLEKYGENVILMPVLP